MEEPGARAARNLSALSFGGTVPSDLKYAGRLDSTECSGALPPGRAAKIARSDAVVTRIRMRAKRTSPSPANPYSFARAASATPTADDATLADL